MTLKNTLSKNNSIYHRCSWPKKEIQYSKDSFKLLYLYILIQTLKDLIKGNEIERKDAYWWFQQDDPSISNSFSTICLTLGIYPSKIRNEIFNYFNEKSKKQFLKSFDKFIVQYKEKFSVSNNLRFKENRNLQKKDVHSNIKKISNPMFL